MAEGTSMTTRLAHLRAVRRRAGDGGRAGRRDRQSRGGPSDAAEDTLGGKQLKIMAPADPGGGWDCTARAMQDALEDIVGRSEVYNVTGAGGTIGLSQFVQLDGQSNQLMVMGLVMVGAIAANDPDVTLDQVTPIARAGQRGAADRRTQADSPIKDVGDLEDAMKKDIRKVAWAGGSAGGAEQILAGLIAQALELDGRATSTTSRTPVAVRRSRRCSRAGHGRGLRASRSSSRRSRPASCGRSPSPAPSGSTSCRTHRR